MTSTRVTLTSRDGGNFEAYLGMPDAPNGGAIIVLQEIFGINANIRRIADDFAAAGFFAMAPDLFWRQGPGIELDPGSEADRTRAIALLNGLNLELAVEDALVAARYLQQSSRGEGKVGCVGYCLGGKLAYLLATHPEIACAISYYGTGIQASLDQARNISCPTLLHIAMGDHLCPPEAQASIVEAMKPHQDFVTVTTYPGVGHAFARHGSSAFDAASAARADAATLEILKKSTLS